MAETKFCPNCGAAVESGRNTCPQCGELLPVKNSSADGQQNNGQIPIAPMNYEAYNAHTHNDGAADGFAIAGMVLGIVSIVLCCFSFLNFILGIAGIILSILGVKSYKYKGCAIAGIVCSAAGTMLSVVQFLSLVTYESILFG